MDYNKYIASKEWDEKRKARKKLDGYRCRLCDEDGTHYQLEVHHRPSAYAKIPNESIEDDLITVCSRCHNLITDVIREDRYGRLEHEPTTITTNIQIRQEIYHGLENTNIQTELIRPADNAQRADGRPNKQVVEVNQTDFIQTRKDRRGS